MPGNHHLWPNHRTLIALFFAILTGHTPSFTYGQELLNWDLDSSTTDRWKVAVGGHFATRKLIAEQVKKNDSSHSVKNIGDSAVTKDFKILEWSNFIYLMDSGNTIDMEYFKTSRDEFVTIKKTISFFGAPVRLGLRMPISLDTESFKIRYGYKLFSDDQFNIRATVGIRDFLASVTYQHEDGTRHPDNHKILLPTIGMFADYKANNHWRWVARVDWLPFRANGNSVQIVDAEASLEHVYSSSCSVGIGYRYSLISDSINREHWSGNLNYIVRGPLLYAATSF